MSKFDCRSEFCFHYGKGRFYCNCRLANRSGSAAFTQECAANRRRLAFEDWAEKMSGLGIIRISKENQPKIGNEGKVL